MMPPAPLVVSAPPASSRLAASSQKQLDGGHQQRRLDTLRLRRVFDMFDRDGDGFITPAELSGALGRLGLGLGHDSRVPAPPGPAGALDAVVAAYVAPGMAGLRFADFEALHADLAAADAGGDHAAHGKEDEEMREAFRVFDEDGDGYISAAELQAVLTRMGLPEAGCFARVRDMIAAADRNSDGRVDFEEFKAMMAGGTDL